MNFKQQAGELSFRERMRSQLKLCGTTKREDGMPFGENFMASELGKFTSAFLLMVINELSIVQ
jgi:hypothetical protein